MTIWQVLGLICAGVVGITMLLLIVITIGLLFWDNEDESHY